MSRRLKAILEEYRPDSGDAYVSYPSYPDKTGSGTSYRVDFTEAFRNVCRNTGLDWVTPHKLRHTFASRHAIAGTSIYKIKQWMGHSNIKTTEVYAHLSPDDEDIDSF